MFPVAVSVREGWVATRCAPPMPCAGAQHCLPRRVPGRSGETVLPAVRNLRLPQAAGPLFTETLSFTARQAADASVSSSRGPEGVRERQNPRVGLGRGGC